MFSLPNPAMESTSISRQAGGALPLDLRSPMREMLAV